MRKISLISFMVLLAGTLARADDAPPKRLADYILMHVYDGRLTVFVAHMIVVHPPDALHNSSYADESERLANAGAVKIRESFIGIGRDWQAILKHNEGAQTIVDSVDVWEGAVRFQRVISITDTDGAPKRILNVYLEQRMKQDPGVQPPVGFAQMTIDIDGKTGGSGEKSFGELWAKHPDDMRQYIMPIFRSLDIKGVFEPDPAQTANAFGPILLGLSSGRGEIEDLISRLDSDSFTTRSAAVEELNKTGVWAIPLMQSLDLKPKSVEGRVAIKSFMDGKPDFAWSDPLLKNVDYLMLCLASDDPRIPELAKNQLEKLAGKPFNFDLKASLSDRQATVEKLRLAGFEKP